MKPVRNHGSTHRMPAAAGAGRSPQAFTPRNAQSPPDIRPVKGKASSISLLRDSSQRLTGHGI